jgi:hypothetical protein
MGKTLSRSRALTWGCRAGFTARPSGLPGRQPWRIWWNTETDAQSPMWNLLGGGLLLFEYAGLRTHRKAGKQIRPALDSGGQGHNGRDLERGIHVTAEVLAQFRN